MNMTAASPVFMTEEILAEVSESMAGGQTWMTRRGEVVHEAFSLIMKPEVGDAVLVARSKGKTAKILVLFSIVFSIAWSIPV